MSQPVFAELLYVTKDTAAKWGQGLRKPSGSALRLLEIAEKRPHVLVEALEVDEIKFVLSKSNS